MVGVGTYWSYRSRQKRTSARERRSIILLSVEEIETELAALEKPESQTRLKKKAVKKTSK